MPRLRTALLGSLTALLVAAPAAAADCPAADVQPNAGNLTEVRAAVVCLTNEQRGATGLPALGAEGRLDAAAQAYSQRMVSERFFSHTGPDGSTLGRRLAGYVGWSAIGENIAWGEGTLATPRATVRAWMASPGHRANILSSSFAEMGVGVVNGTPEGFQGPSATYTANYGARDGVSAPATSGAPAPPASGAPGAAPRRAPAARKPVKKCRRGTVRRVKRTKSGRRVVVCVKAVRGRKA